MARAFCTKAQCDVRAEPDDARRGVLFYYPFNQTMTGGPRTVLNLIADIDQRGLRPVVVSQNENPLIEEVRRRGMEAHVLPFPPILDVYDKAALSYSLGKKLRAGAAVLAYNCRLAWLAQRREVRAIWARNIRGVLMTAAAARWRGLPLVWDIGREVPLRGFVRLLPPLALCAATTVVTQARRQPEAIFGERTARLFSGTFRTIYPGIDPERKKRIRSACREEDRRKEREKRPLEFLCVGTVGPRKNQLMLLRALSEMTTEERSQVRVRFAGESIDGDYEQRLQATIRREGLERHVEFMGWREDVPELMSRSNVLVLCSRDEGVPHTIREAMQAGLPVVGTRVGGVPETIRHGETGFLVALGDVERLRECLVHLAENPCDRRKMGQAARRWAEQRFSQEAWRKEYHDLLYALAHSGVAHSGRQTASARE